MAKNRFAQPLYGKIIYIYETDLTMDQLSLIFSPKTYWIDVTGIDCEVGYVQEFREGEGIVWVAPPNEEYSFEELKANKIAEMKAIRDSREESVIYHNEVPFDYDSKSRERLNSARRGLEDENPDGVELWTNANNEVVSLSLEDFIAIDKLARDRSRELHIRYNKLKLLINAVATEEELKSVHFDVEF